MRKNKRVRFDVFGVGEAMWGHDECGEVVTFECEAECGALHQMWRYDEYVHGTGVRNYIVDRVAKNEKVLAKHSRSKSRC